LRKLNLISIDFNAFGLILFVISACAVELSVCIGVGGCGCPILIRVCRIGMAALTLMNNPPISASAADDTTCFKIPKIFKTAPLLTGIFSVPAK
jgi:hypothetical protein